MEKLCIKHPNFVKDTKVLIHGLCHKWSSTQTLLALRLFRETSRHWIQEVLNDVLVRQMAPPAKINDVIPINEEYIFFYHLSSFLLPKLAKQQAVSFMAFTYVNGNSLEILSGVQGLTLDEFVSAGVRMYSSVTITALHQILTEISPLVRTDEDGSPYWMFPLLLNLIFEGDSTDIPEHKRICWLDEHDFLGLKTKMDNFLGLVAKWKHVLTLDRKDSNPELYWQLEDSFLTTEEAFVVAHYENLYSLVCSQHCITSEVFFQDFELATLNKDIKACGRVFSAGNTVNFKRFQAFQAQCDLKNNATIPLTSLTDSTLLVTLRHTASYYKVSLMLKDMICQSLTPLAEKMSDKIVENFLVNSGILTGEEAQMYLKHALFIQELIEDNQTFVLLLLLLTINDQTELESLRRFIGRLLLKKFYTKIRVDASTDEEDYPRALDNPIDLIQAKEPLRSSMDIFDDFFQSFLHVKKAHATLNIV